MVTRKKQNLTKSQGNTNSLVNQFIILAIEFQSKLQVSAEWQSGKRKGTIETLSLKENSEILMPYLYQDPKNPKLTE